jgi:hypothetical protein
MLLFAFAGCAVPATEPDTSFNGYQELAIDTMITFFEHLNAGRYAEAATLYGGTYEIMVDHNPSVNPGDHAKLMEHACTINGCECLLVKSVRLDNQDTPGVFVFHVEFKNDDGSLFVLGPCCGADETTQPPQSVFAITVTQDDEGHLWVMDMPPYMP